jgi:hypothetical protein
MSSLHVNLRPRRVQGWVMFRPRNLRRGQMYQMSSVVSVRSVHGRWLLHRPRSSGHSVRGLYAVYCGKILSENVYVCVYVYVSLCMCMYVFVWQYSTYPHVCACTYACNLFFHPQVGFCDGTTKMNGISCLDCKTNCSVGQYLSGWARMYILGYSESVCPCAFVRIFVDDTLVCLSLLRRDILIVLLFILF